LIWLVSWFRKTSNWSNSELYFSRIQPGFSERVLLAEDLAHWFRQSCWRVPSPGSFTTLSPPINGTYLAGQVFHNYGNSLTGTLHLNGTVRHIRSHQEQLKHKFVCWEFVLMIQGNVCGGKNTVRWYLFFLIAGQRTSSR
jgi:hypothetical protein